MTSKLLFICGGAWSGKTDRALLIARDYEHVLWIGTAAHLLPELKSHIETLKSKRPGHWSIVDQSFDLPKAVKEGRAQHPASLIVIDSISQWLANEIARQSSRYDEQQLQAALLHEIDELCSELEVTLRTNPVVVVSSDFGASLPPQDAPLRSLRKVTGLANQTISSRSDIVEFLTAGVVTFTKERGS